MSIQRTLSLLKPDGLSKGLVCTELTPSSDLHIIEARQLQPSLELAQQHYHEHKDKPCFKDITEGLACGEVIALIIEGENAIKRVREIMGNRETPNTIRGKYSTPNIQHENGVHGSDSIESAAREIKLWFPDLRS